MRQKILLPLDGSITGEAALPYVEDLISKFLPEPKVEVTLIQVLSSLSHYIIAGEAAARVPYSPEEIEYMKKQSNKYLRKVAKDLRDKGATTKVLVTIGDAADEIIQTADDKDIDIIAMSTHGRSGISRWAFGSVTDKVLRGGHKPVLVVRAPKETE